MESNSSTDFLSMASAEPECAAVLWSDTHETSVFSDIDGPVYVEAIACLRVPRTSFPFCIWALKS